MRRSRHMEAALDGVSSSYQTICAASASSTKHHFVHNQLKAHDSSIMQHHTKTTQSQRLGCATNMNTKNCGASWDRTHIHIANTPRAQASPVINRVPRFHTDRACGRRPLPSRHSRAGSAPRTRGAQAEAQDIGRNQQRQEGNQQRAS